jgi:hypothetical protein
VKKTRAASSGSPQEVPVPVLVGLVPAGDDVDGHPPATGELVDGGRLARRERGLDEPGPVRDEDLQPLRPVQDALGDRPPVRAARAVADEDPVEPARVVRPGHPVDVPGVDPVVVAEPARLAGVAGRNQPDDLN